LFLTTSLACGAQDSITLFACHRSAEENAPRLKDRQHLREIGELNVRDAQTPWYPELEINGKISYQSDVVTVALTDPSIPVSFPEVPHDQYGLNLDLRQTLYDGGIARQKKEYEQALTAAELQQLEVDLYQLKNRVNQYYYGILVLQENLQNLAIHRASLEAREQALETAVREGAQLPSELKVIQVELLRISQSELEVRANRQALLGALNILCGTRFSASDVFTRPVIDLPEISGLNRPEFELFELQDATMEAGKQVLSKKRMPVLYAFGQAGYGNPGYNMLSSDWDFYYMVGAGLKWRIWDWNSTNREKQKIGHRQQVLQNQRNTFDLEIQSRLVREEANMERYRKAVELEEQMLRLHTEITAISAEKLENGTITATEYITELNKESLVRISLATHEVLLSQSIANYLTIQGNI